MTLSEYAMKFIGIPYIWGGDGSGKCGTIGTQKVCLNNYLPAFVMDIA